MPLLDHIPQRGIDHPLLLEHVCALESMRRNLNGVHAAAAARDVLDEEFGGFELVGEEFGDGGLGFVHGGVEGRGAQEGGGAEGAEGVEERCAGAQEVVGAHHGGVEVEVVRLERRNYSAGLGGFLVVGWVSIWWRVRMVPTMLGMVVHHRLSRWKYFCAFFLSGTTLEIESCKCSYFVFVFAFCGCSFDCRELWVRCSEL